jgi:hypothetical protein
MMRHDLLATTNYTTATARMPDTIVTVENISPQFPWRLGLGDYGVDFSTLRQSCSFRSTLASNWGCWYVYKDEEMSALRIISLGSSLF